MKRFKLLIPAMLIALSLNGCSGSDVEETATSTAEITAVQVQEVDYSSIKKELTYGGTVTANQTVDVTPKVSGRVETILVDVGDRVEKGQVLFTIDKKDIQDQIDQLQASLAVSNASVASAQTSLSQVDGGQTQSTRLSLENAVTNAQTSVDNASVSLDTARSSFEDTEKKYNDYKTMYESGIISKSDYDSIELGYTQAKNAYDQAQLAYDSAVTALTQAQDSLNIFDNQTMQDSRDSAQAGVNSASASRDAVLVQIKQLQDSLNDTTVVSPISGVISAKNIEVTNMVSTASVPFTISATDTVTVDVNVSERIINKIEVGDKINLTVSTVSDDVIEGTIKTINRVVDSTGTYPVSILVDNSDGSLRAGMFAAVVFTEEYAENTIVVPEDTVLENLTEKYVFVADNQKAVKCIVETGIDNGKEIEIISGVNVGDNVIVSGQSYLADGDSINVVTGEE